MMVGGNCKTKKSIINPDPEPGLPNSVNILKDVGVKECLWLPLGNYWDIYTNVTSNAISKIISRNIQEPFK